MDAALLTQATFWNDPTPHAFGRFEGGVPDLSELAGQVLFETSGSSGTPKWIALGKAALLTSARAVNAHLQVTGASCWGLALPAHHVGGFGVAARAHAAGCGFMEFGQRWDPVAFHRWLLERRVSHVSLVPTQVHDLVAANLRSPSSLHAVVVGGGHLTMGTGIAARGLGWPVLASYGMTEAGSQIATQSLEALHRPYRPAPIPILPIWQVSVSNDQRLSISGPALFSGMLVKQPAWQLIARVSPWYETQDRVMLEEHQITPLGRADSRVKVLGELVDPEGIEIDLIESSAGILAVGSFVIVAVPDERMEHALVPVLDPSIDRHSAELLLTHHNEKSPAYLRLRPAIVLNPFPRGALGKPLRAEIKSNVNSWEA